MGGGMRSDGFFWFVVVLVPLLGGVSGRFDQDRVLFECGMLRMLVCGRVKTFLLSNSGMFKREKE